MLEDPEEVCCRHAASFFTLQCHCWSSQFDTAAVAAVAAVDSACLHVAAAHRGSVDVELGAGGEAAVQQQQPDGGAAEQQQQQQREGAAGAAGAAAAGTVAVRLFVGVLSVGAKREARDAIRATWGSHPAPYRVRFFLARPADDAVFEQAGHSGRVGWEGGGGGSRHGALSADLYQATCTQERLLPGRLRGVSSSSSRVVCCWQLPPSSQVQVWAGAVERHARASAQLPAPPLTSCQAVETAATLRLLLPSSLHTGPGRGS